MNIYEWNISLDFVPLFLGLGYILCFLAFHGIQIDIKPLQAHVWAISMGI